MRYLIFIFLICLSKISFGQMSYNQLNNIAMMNSDQFESYAIDNGYHFDKYLDEYNRVGVVYSKGSENSYKRLTYYYTNKFLATIKEVEYFTTNTREVLNFRKSVLNNGFRLGSSDVNADYNSRFESYGKYSPKKDETVFIHTYPPDDEFPYVQYSINFWTNTK